MGHPQVRLAQTIDWTFLGREFGEVYRPGAGHAPLPVRLMAGLLILKHMHSLSDEALRARWVENPYFQYFCGEEVFQHELRFDRSSLTRWRRRLGEDRLAALIQESLSVAHKSGALATRDLERVAVDTTVQPKAIAHPTDARLTHRAIEKLVAFAWDHRIKLRQSYLRLAKRAAIMVGRYHPRPPVQPRPTRAPLPAHPPRPAHSRHQPQDRRQRRPGEALRAAALIGRPGPPPDPAATRPEGLFAARTGGRVYRQREGSSALRVRLQGEPGNTRHEAQGRPVRAPRQGAPRQSL